VETSAVLRVAFGGQVMGKTEVVEWFFNSKLWNSNKLTNQIQQFYKFIT
jgi:hypothetical protein